MSEEIVNTNNTDHIDTQPITSVEEAMKEIERLRSINKEVIASRDETKYKLRTFETEAEERARQALEEQGKYKEMYETTATELTTLRSSIKEKEVNEALRSELAQVGALSVDTVLKLINKSAVEFEQDGTVKVDSVKALIKELKKSDPVLFGTEKAPDVKRAGESDNANTFEVELRKAKTQKEISAILQKFGKIK